MNEEEKREMWDEIADWFSQPEELRDKSNKEIYEALQIPERTFYWYLQNADFNRLIIQKTLYRAKKHIPKVIEVLQKNIYEGKEKSMEMYFKYVAELADKIDHTTKGEKIESTVNVNFSELDVMAETFEKKIKEKYETNPTAEGVSEK